MNWKRVDTIAANHGNGVYLHDGNTTQNQVLSNAIGIGRFGQMWNMGNHQRARSLTASRATR